MSEVRFADVVAGVQATIAAYTHAVDDGRVEDVVGTFTPDGVIELVGMGTHTGHDEIRVAATTDWAPRGPQRHLVVNTHVQEWTATTATAVSDVVFTAKGERGWAVHMVGRYTDHLVLVGDRWLFQRRHAAFS